MVMPRGPRCAKGLLLSSIRSKDPVVFLEPKVCVCKNISSRINFTHGTSFILTTYFVIVSKILYRSAVEEVPDADYEIPLGKAEIMRAGNDVTIVGWGAQLFTLQAASIFRS